MTKNEIRRYRRAVRRFDRQQKRQMKTCCATVTPSQCHLLMELDENGTVPSGELARLLDIDASTMTRAADRLVGEGLIARGVDPGDHRVNTLSLTAAGRRICDQLHKVNDAATRQIFAALPGGRERMVLEAFEDLVEAMQESGGESGGGKCCGEG